MNNKYAGMISSKYINLVNWEVAIWW